MAATLPVSATRPRCADPKGKPYRPSHVGHPAGFSGHRDSWVLAHRRRAQCRPRHPAFQRVPLPLTAARAMSVFRSIVFSAVLAGCRRHTRYLRSAVATVPLILRAEVYERQAAAAEHQHAPTIPALLPSTSRRSGSLPTDSSATPIPRFSTSWTGSVSVCCSIVRWCCCAARSRAVKVPLGLGASLLRRRAGIRCRRNSPGIPELAVTAAVVVGRDRPRDGCGAV